MRQISGVSVFANGSLDMGSMVLASVVCRFSNHDIGLQCRNKACIAMEFGY